MDFQSILVLSVLIFIGASLYSSVGHGGASGYLVAMALFGLAPHEMKPAALTLNIFVSSIAVFQYLRAGRFNFSIFWPFALASIPAAYVGGYIQLPAAIYKPLFGLLLIFTAYQFLQARTPRDYDIRRPPVHWVLFSGGILGFTAGLLGIGGGIFLSPLVILMRWEKVVNVSGIAACFVWVNSVAGILGFLTSGTSPLPTGIEYWIVAAIIGAVVGSTLGSRYLSGLVIKKILGLVILAAGLRMILSIWF